MSILLDDPTTHSVPDDDRRLTLAEILDRGRCHRLPVNIHEDDAVAANSSGADKVRAPILASALSANNSGSDKASSPPTGVDLQRIAANATRARRKGKGERAALAFPPLRRVYAKARTDAQTGEITRRARSYYLDIWDYLQTWGYRILNDLQGVGLAPPAHTALLDLFLDRILDRARVWHPLDGHGHGLVLDDAHKLADTAAAATLRDWSADYIEQQRRRGAAGGRASRRGPTWTPQQLADLQALDGLTVGQQALQLGLNSSKVKRMRAEIRRARERPQ